MDDEDAPVFELIDADTGENLGLLFGFENADDVQRYIAEKYPGRFIVMRRS